MLGMLDRTTGKEGWGPIGHRATEKKLLEHPVLYADPAPARKRKRGTKTEEQEGKKREQKRRGGGTRSRNPNDTQSHTDPEPKGRGGGGTGGRPLFVHSEAAYEQKASPGTWGHTHQTPAQSLRESLTSSSP